jgi:hypothetical protein
MLLIHQHPENLAMVVTGLPQAFLVLLFIMLEAVAARGQVKVLWLALGG